MKISGILNTATNLMFPPRCILCGDNINIISNLWRIQCVCDRCSASYKSLFAEVCPVCNKSVSSCSCGVKMGRGEISPLAKCFFYKPQKESYAGNRVIYAIKHVDDKRITKMMAKELSFSIREMMDSEGLELPECIFTFVPRRASAIYKDGFDQGKRLAIYTARVCGKPYKAKSLIVRRGGKEQKKLDARKRQKNLSGALELKPFAKRKIRGKTVCVVDDVVTSGATMKSAERLLLSAGAERVIFACIARTRNEK